MSRFHWWKNNPSIQDLRKHGKLVQVLHVENPQLLFVKKIVPDGNLDTACISQVALWGLFPASLNYSMSCSEMTTEPGEVWTPGSIKMTRHFIEKSKEIYCVPMITGEHFRLFEHVPCMFAKLFLINHNNEIGELGDLLCKSNVAVFCIEKFNLMYENKTVITDKPSDAVKKNIDSKLQLYIKKKKTIFEETRNVDERKIEEFIMYSTKNNDLNNCHNEDISSNSSSSSGSQKMKRPKNVFNSSFQNRDKCEMPRSNEFHTKKINNTDDYTEASVSHNISNSGTTRTTRTKNERNKFVRSQNNTDTTNTEKAIITNKSGIGNNFSKNEKQCSTESVDPCEKYLIFSPGMTGTRNKTSSSPKPFTQTTNDSTHMGNEIRNQHPGEKNYSDKSTPSSTKTNISNHKFKQFDNQTKKLDLNKKQVKTNYENWDQKTKSSHEEQNNNYYHSSSSQKNSLSPKIDSKNYLQKDVTVSKEKYELLSNVNNIKVVNENVVIAEDKMYDKKLSSNMENSIKKESLNNEVNVSNTELREEKSVKSEIKNSFEDDPNLALSDTDSQNDLNVYHKKKSLISPTKTLTKKNATVGLPAYFKKCIDRGEDFSTSPADNDNASNVSSQDLHAEVQFNLEHPTMIARNNSPIPSRISISKEFSTSITSNRENDFVNQECTPKLLVHMRNGRPPSRWLDKKSACFSTEIHDNLSHMNMTTPTSSQSAIWPSIMRGHNTLLVGPKNSGKSLGFIVPLCSLISNMDIPESLPRGHSPLAWIVCSSRESVVKVELMCKSLLKTRADIPILKIDGALSHDDTVNLLFANCSILISTPVLVKYAKQTHGLNLNRLLFIAFDDVDVLNDKFYTEVSLIYNVCSDILKQRNNKELNIQIMATSRTWCTFMYNLINSIDNPVLCINAFRECILYSQLEMITIFTKNIDKLTDLKIHLNKHKEILNRILIVCENDKEVKNVCDGLKEIDFHVMSALKLMSFKEIVDIGNEWKNNSLDSIKTILVCCDSNLHNLNITNVDCLIHFSLPSSLPAFDDRFSSLVDSIPRIWDNPKNAAKSIPKILICVDENCNLQLPKIVDLMQRCNFNISEDIENISNNIKNLKDFESAKSLIPLCNELMCFGRCFKSDCPKRHTIVPEYDNSDDWLPETGFINFKLMHIKNPCQYSARLYSHISNDGAKIEFEQNYLELAMKMCSFYLDNRNKIHLNSPKPGEICMAEIEVNQFLRCQIVKFHENKNKNSASRVLVRLIDQNRFVSCETRKLYNLPDEFKHVKTNVIQIIITGIIPIDKDVTWSAKATDKIEQYYSNLGNEIYLRGKIVLRVGNTYWLESVQCCTKLLSCDRTVVRSNVKSYITKNDIGIPNPEHVPLLYNICKKSHVDISKYYTPKKTNIIVKKEEKLPEPQWAFIESDNSTEILFSCGINPDLFFIRIAKYQSCLDLLQNDIEKYILKLKNSIVPLATTLFTEGQICLTKNSDDKFYRSRIDKLKIDDNSENIYTCFFVDFGDFIDVKVGDLYPISPQLILQIPFQAIECRLLGIKSPVNEWSDAATDFLYDFCFVSHDSDILKLLMVRQYCIEKPQITNGEKFAVIIFDEHSETEKLLNDAFISKTLAVPLDSELSLFDGAKKYMAAYLSRYSFKEEDFDAVDVDSDEFSISSETDFSKILINPEDNNWLCSTGFPELSYSFDDNDLNDSTDSNKARLVEISNDADISNLNFDTQSSDDVAKLQPYVPPLQLSYRTPFVKWHQTDANVFLKIDLIGVEDYTISITDNRVKFECVLKGVEYKLDLELYGSVIPNQCSHCCKGLYVNVKLTKTINLTWDSLLKTVKKVPWLSIDYDPCDTSDNEDNQDEEDKVIAKKEMYKRLQFLDIDSDPDEDFYENEEISELAQDVLLNNN